MLAEINPQVVTEHVHLQMPSTALQLAAALRDESSSLICPFGHDMLENDVQCKASQTIVELSSAQKLVSPDSPCNDELAQPEWFVVVAAMPT